MKELEIIVKEQRKIIFFTREQVKTHLNKDHKDI